jgi:hypothetical protein
VSEIGIRASIAWRFGLRTCQSIFDERRRICADCRWKRGRRAICTNNSFLFCFLYINDRWRSREKYDTHLPKCISQCLCFLISQQALNRASDHKLDFSSGGAAQPCKRPGRPDSHLNSKLWVCVALLNLVPIGNRRCGAEVAEDFP